MFDTHDEWIGKWGHKPGPRVGDWCETKDGGLHRIGAIRGESIRLAGPSGRFSLGSGRRALRRSRRQDRLADAWKAGRSPYDPDG
jgi:hypothetical protein